MTNTIARFAIATYFIFEGIHTAISYDHGSRLLVETGMPGASIVLLLLIALKLGGGLFLLLGYQVRYAAGALIGSALLSPLLFRSGLMAVLNEAAIAAGLLLLVTYGAGQTLWEYAKVDLKDLPDYKTRL